MYRLATEPRRVGNIESLEYRNGMYQAVQRMETIETELTSINHALELPDSTEAKKSGELLTVLAITRETAPIPTFKQETSWV